MKKQAYKNEDLIQQVQIYLNKILEETGNKQKKLKESIISTLEILKEDFKLVQEQQNEKSLSPQNEAENINNENIDTTTQESNTAEVEKTDEVIENSKQDEPTEISNISEPTETKIKVTLIR